MGFLFAIGYLFLLFTFSVTYTQKQTQTKHITHPLSFCGLVFSISPFQKFSRLVSKIKTTVPSSLFKFKLFAFTERERKTKKKTKAHQLMKEKVGSLGGESLPENTSTTTNNNNNIKEADQEAEPKLPPF